MARRFQEKDFLDKVAGVFLQAGREVIKPAVILYFVMKSPKVPWYVKAEVAAVLAYFISPADAIPDLIPVLGYSDDLAAMSGVIALVSAYVDDDVRAKTNEMLNALFGPKEG